MSSLSHLKEHIQSIKKRCLVNYVPQEFSTKRKVEITLQNGVTAVLRVHECYPFVCPIYLPLFSLTHHLLLVIGSEWYPCLLPLKLWRMVRGGAGECQEDREWDVSKFA
jgi:hypothetical protein